MIGHGETGLHEALFLRTYRSDITLLSLGQKLGFSDGDHRTARSAGILLMEQAMTGVANEGNRIGSMTAQGGACLPFDSLYSALGSTARSDGARGLGAELDEKGCIVSDEHQRSSIDGLFAAGHVVRSLDQIGVAMGEAAIAIHNRLRGVPAPEARRRP